MSGSADRAVLDYYPHDGSDPVRIVDEPLRQTGRDPQRISLDDLAGVDEFHALGRAATMVLADLALIGEDERVVDIGAGIGGPARYLAGATGCSGHRGRAH